MDLTNQNVIAQVRTHKTVLHRDEVENPRRGRRAPESEVVNTFLVKISLDDQKFAAVDPNAAWAAPVAQTGAWAEDVIAECRRVGYNVVAPKRGRIRLEDTELFDDPDNRHLVYRYVGFLEVFADDPKARREAQKALGEAARGEIVPATVAETAW